MTTDVREDVIQCEVGERSYRPDTSKLVSVVGIHERVDEGLVGAKAAIHHI